MCIGQVTWKTSMYIIIVFEIWIHQETLTLKTKTSQGNVTIEWTICAFRILNPRQ